MKSKSKALKKSGEDAFVLIELLVVVAIIGLLASMMRVGLVSARARGLDIALVKNAQQLTRALQLYYEDNGQYPTNGMTLGYCPSGAVAQGMYCITQYPYMPNDPTGANIPALGVSLQTYMAQLPASLTGAAGTERRMNLVLFGANFVGPAAMKDLQSSTCYFPSAYSYMSWNRVRSVTNNPMGNNSHGYILIGGNMVSGPAPMTYQGFACN